MQQMTLWSGTQGTAPGSAHRRETPSAVTRQGGNAGDALLAVGQLGDRATKVLLDDGDPGRIAPAAITVLRASGC